MAAPALLQTRCASAAARKLQAEDLCGAASAWIERANIEGRLGLWECTQSQDGSGEGGREGAWVCGREAETRRCSPAVRKRRRRNSDGPGVRSSGEVASPPRAEARESKRSARDTASYARANTPRMPIMRGGHCEMKGQGSTRGGASRHSIGRSMTSGAATAAGVVAATCTAVPGATAAAAAWLQLLRRRGCSCCGGGAAHDTLQQPPSACCRTIVVRGSLARIASNSLTIPANAGRSSGLGAQQREMRSLTSCSAEAAEGPVESRQQRRQPDTSTRALLPIACALQRMLNSTCAVPRACRKACLAGTQVFESLPPPLATPGGPSSLGAAA